MAEKPNKYETPQEPAPIPTYDEAIAIRHARSQSFLGPQEISNDAERQGLLAGIDERRRHHSEEPQNHNVAGTIGSQNHSLDYTSSAEESERDSVDGLHREISQMEVVDPEENLGRHFQRGTRLSKHFTSLSHIRQWLPSIPERFRPGHVMIGRVFGIFLIVSFVYILFLSDVFSIGQKGRMGLAFDPEDLRMYVQDHMSESRIRESLQHITQFDHIAGSEGDYVLAKWVESLFNTARFEDAGLERFDVYLNYPKIGGRKVSIIDPPELKWEAIIEEEPAYTDPLREQSMVFHGHSRSGNVTGPLIYANYGSLQDFKLLQDNGINTKGAIVLVRYYGTQGDRALKVKAAELAGAAGCIIYSDPAEDGFRMGETWPDGRFMPSDGVQRGAVSLMSWVVGDVLSPGFASLPGERRRESKDDNPGLNNIPSIPLAWRDAQKLLQAVEGHGMLAPDSWVGGVPDVEWWSGDQSSPTVNLMNEQDEVERQPIYNVLGKITGLEQPEKSIIVGNHRDAWCLGASDPGSGTAVLLEVARIFGDLLKLGWRPLRSVTFCSWSGEEYNLIGSTEHVENRLEDLRRDGFAYLNVDVAVQGDQFEAAACPIFERALLRVLDRTSDPSKNQSLRELWESKHSKLSGLGAGSDYVAFQDMAGTSSFDMGFRGPPYPYHSCYDNFEWMDKFGDPGFVYHKTLAQVWALLILEMADRPVLPYDLEAYASAVQQYVAELEAYADGRDASQASLQDGTSFNLGPLRNAAGELVDNAKLFHEWDIEYENEVANSGFETNVMAIKRISHNTRMANFETNLLDVEGLPGREQFAHILFAPQRWSGYDEGPFPGIRDAIDDGDWDLAQRQVEKVSSILSYASRKLNH